MARTRFCLPVLHRVGLTGFSLYTEKPKVDLEISGGVTCLMGANGIGKTTFIAAVNFGLCGRLPEPGRVFRSSDEYFQDARSFSESFFDGRITDLDRARAAIDLEFTIGSDCYHITRGAFETDELRFATLNGTPLDEPSEPSLAGLNDLYKANVASSVGVSTFEQFVFLQLFIFTFDERRNLTFWEDEVQRQMLMLSFGEDVQDVQGAENLLRSIERLDSRARNANYRANEIKKRFRDSAQILQNLDPDTLDLRAEREELDRMFDDLTSKESEVVAYLSDSKLRISDLRSKSLVLRDKIENVFAKRSARNPDLKIRPLVADSLASGLCQLCGASGSTVISCINSRISLTECPLCGSGLPEEPVSEDFQNDLVQLDSEFANLGQEIEEETKRQHRIQAKVAEIQASIAEQRKRVLLFEQQHHHIAESIGTTDVKEIQNLIVSYKRVISDAEQDKLNARRERDNLKSQLEHIQRRISLQYEQDEQEFLHIFRSLAEAFIGLDLDVQFDAQGTEMRLVLSMESKPRRKHHQLSESQRFFVDIALRMAITRFISARETGTFLIDTPEGSLDIAYESRAGKMFAQFIEGGYHLLMTANINTSQLLRKLARQCNSENMHIERMTEWTLLSDVQVEADAQGLFQEAFDAIEQELKETPE